jgi:hypothetical protein
VDLSAQLDMYHHHIYTIVICADMNLMSLLLELNNETWLNCWKTWVMHELKLAIFVITALVRYQKPRFKKSEMHGDLPLAVW